MQMYKTLAKHAENEIIIKKSRFITNVMPVCSEDEAQEFIRGINKRHRDATHNVYAYRITENLEKYSDDGEPSGTAGMPVLNVIKGKELYNSCVVVTRYYGGIMLGAGGLVRAYSQSADKGLTVDNIITKRLYQILTITFHLAKFGIVKRIVEDFQGAILNVEVTYEATLQVRLPVVRVEELTANLVEVLAGQVELQSVEQIFV